MERKPWDHYDRFKNLKIFNGDVKDFEEWSVKFRSLVAAADVKVTKLMKSVEADGTAEELVKGKYNELTPEIGQDDAEVLVKTSPEMCHVVLNITTGEANEVVRRSLGSGWLAWKRLTSSLNPRTLASGIKSISAALNPQRITTASTGRCRGGRMGGQAREAPDRVRRRTDEQNEGAVLDCMMPKDFQERVLDACADCLGWDFRGGCRSAL